MKTVNDWVNEISSQIESLKRNSICNYYGFSLSMDQSTGNQIKTHFENLNYDVELRQCPRRLFDLIIRW